MQPQYIPRSNRFKDITGQRFGRLVALRPVGKKRSFVVWLCACDCGNQTTVPSGLLLSKGTKSCGCLLAELRVKRKLTHGLANSPIYNTWIKIKARCLNTNDHAYPDYGGRGITICPEWCNDFRAFYDHVSTLPHFGEKGYSIDRIDNEKGYEASNVHWATLTEQARNKRNNRHYFYQGKSQTLPEWAEELGIPFRILAGRIRKHKWSIERAFSAPVRKR